MNFTYSDGTKVGEQEKHLTKVGTLFLNAPYTVTFVSKNNTVSFVDYATNKTFWLDSGTVLNSCGLLKTGVAQVEIRSFRRKISA